MKSGVSNHCIRPSLYFFREGEFNFFVLTTFVEVGFSFYVSSENESSAVCFIDPNCEIFFSRGVFYVSG